MWNRAFALQKMEPIHLFGCALNKDVEHKLQMDTNGMLMYVVLIVRYVTVVYISCECLSNKRGGLINPWGRWEDDSRIW